MKKILFFQHHVMEHPAALGALMAADGAQVRTVALDSGEPIPSLSEFDAMVVLGGPMDVWQEDEYPWLIEEKAAIRRWVHESHRPFLGICLGHQLLAEAMGGRVGRLARAEIGIHDVMLTEAGRTDPVFAGLPDTLPALEWHGAQIEMLPEGAVLLAENPECAVQAMRLGSVAYGVQFHCEKAPNAITEWRSLPAYAQQLEEHFGPGGTDRFERLTQRKMHDLQAVLSILYRNWVDLTLDRSVRRQFTRTILPT